MPHTAALTTARDLLTAVQPFGPSIEAEELVFDRDPPADLLPALCALHTGLRAILTCREWWGSSDVGEKRPRVAILNPGEPIPEWCGLLCVANDSKWDRILAPA